MIRKSINRIRDGLKRFAKFGKKTPEAEKIQQSLIPEETQPSTDTPITSRVEKNIQTAAKQKSRKRRNSSKSRNKTPRVKTASTEQETWDVSLFTVPPVEGKKRFHDFNLPVSLMHAISDLGFEYCTPIQAEILQHTLDGNDATGRAQTGTGKTAAFLITLLTRMLSSSASVKKAAAAPRAFIIAPTRELVIQIARDAQSLAKYCHMTVVPVYGGMDYRKQLQQLAEGPVDIVVATPGRLLDFLRQRAIKLDSVETFVIDEADRMLDMGFIPDVRRIIHNLPSKSKRQTLLFSATLTPDVINLSRQWTRDPVTVEIEPEQVAVDTVDQVTYLLTSGEKYALLYNLITLRNLKRVMIFTNRKDEARRLSERLQRNELKCSMLSGDVAQKKRIKILDDFRDGKIQVMVATDVAGRGIHIEDVSHVINYALPHNPEDYVHRIGRTGRAGSEGTSISFATEKDSFQIPDIEEYIGKKLHCIHPPEDLLAPPPPPRKPPEHSHKKRSPPRHGGKRRPPSRYKGRASGSHGKSGNTD